MTVQEVIQSRIDAQQDLDAITYALRACTTVAGGRYPTPRLREQFEDGRRVAEAKCGHAIQLGQVEALRYAKKLAKAEFDAATDALKMIGGKRQLRLAL